MRPTGCPELAARAVTSLKKFFPFIYIFFLNVDNTFF